MSSMMVWLLLSVKRLTSSDIGDTDCSTVNATSLMRITIALPHIMWLWDKQHLTSLIFAAFQPFHFVIMPAIVRKPTKPTPSLKFSRRYLNFPGAVHSLLETLNDKDEAVRESIERSLVRMCRRRPNETMEIICNYRQKMAKLPEAHVAVYLR